MATPTVSVTAGSLSVTGVGTAFIAFPDDLLTVAGISVPIAAASGNAITLKYPWPGATLPDTPNWTLSNVAPAWNAGTQTYLRVNELLDKIAAGLPFSPDANGPLSGRAAFNNQPAGFIYLATDGGAWTIYIKQSATNSAASWSPGFTPQGSPGAAGAPGAPGAPGTPGVKGDTGPANTLTIGTVSAGATAGVTITGTAPNQVLNLTLPKGDKGDTGLKGDTGSIGPANTLTVGSVTTGSPGSSAAISITGAAPNQTISFTVPRGDQGLKGDPGVKGDQGLTGPANTLAVGTVTTGAPGSSASATITGTAPNQTVSLSIPRGDRGASGIDGRPAEFRGNNAAENLEWRLVGDTTWQTLVSYASIQAAAQAIGIGDINGLQAALDGISAQIAGQDDPFITALIFGG